MKVTASDLVEMKIVDHIIKEPVGGAHRKHDEAAGILKETILNELRELMQIPPEQLINDRIEKFGKMGFWSD